MIVKFFSIIINTFIFKSIKIYIIWTQMRPEPSRNNNPAYFQLPGISGIRPDSKKRASRCNAAFKALWSTLNNCVCPILCMYSQSRSICQQCKYMHCIIRGSETAWNETCISIQKMSEWSNRISLITCLLNTFFTTTMLACWYGKL